MFEHLDDPNPPPPRALLVELVVAEGARRRRRRATVAGGMAATLLVLAGGVRLAQAAGSGGDPDVQIENPAAPPPHSPREGGESGDDLSTAPGPDEGAASTTQDDGAPTPPGATAFAGITTGDEVAVGDTSLDGGVLRVLVEAPTDGTTLGDQVALSPDRQTGYYEATPTTGDEAGESAIYKVNTVGEPEPELVDTGTSPAVSPDGSKLAYVQDGAAIVVRDTGTDSGPGQRFAGSPIVDGTVEDLAYTAEGTAIVFTTAPPDGPAALYQLDLTFSVAVSASLNDAGKLGPTDEAPSGTHWSAPDSRRSDGTIGVVETCCAPTASSGTTFAFVDPVTGQATGSEPADGVSGTVLLASYDLSGHNQLVLTVDDGEAYSLYLREADGPLERLDDGTGFRAIDW